MKFWEARKALEEWKKVKSAIEDYKYIMLDKSNTTVDEDNVDICVQCNLGEDNWEIYEAQAPDLSDSLLKQVDRLEERVKELERNVFGYD